MQFRKMRRFKQELTKEDCFELLKNEKRGTLAVVGDGGYPYAIPINFYFDQAENKIYFHSAKEGHKIDAIKKCDKVCFTVYEKGIQKEDWSYHVKSVVVFGRAKEVVDCSVKLEKAKAFGMKYYPSEEEVEIELQKDFNRVQMNEITIEHITGKIVHEK